MKHLKKQCFCGFFLKNDAVFTKKKDFLEILDILCTLVLENLGHA